MSFRTPSWESLTNKTNKLVVWVNNIYPIKVHRLDFRSLLYSIPIQQKLVSMFPKEIKVVSIEKRIKEGGAYVHLEVPENIATADAFEEISAVFKLSKKYFKFASRPAGVKRVLGEPLVEDMDNLIPSDLIKVIPKDTGLTLDTDEVYRLFRHYGKLYNITKKDAQSNQILIEFERLEGSIAARNCLHKAPLPTTKGSIVLVEYVEVHRMGWLKEHFQSNPRLMFPLVGLFATLLGVILFDPVRSWFIKKKMKIPFRAPTDLSNLMNFGALCDRKEEEHLRSHLFSPPSHIMILSAPKGTGKSELVNAVLRGRKNVIVIDFSEMDSVPDADFINYIADRVGYIPTLTWMSQFTGWLDILPLGLSKGTFSWTAHSQLQNICYCLEDSLNSIAHKALDEANPEWPVIILDGFLENLQAMEDRKEAAILMDLVAEFAVKVCQRRGLAHIMIISSEATAVPTVYKLISANGGSKIKPLTLSDVSDETALEFVRTSLIPLEQQPLDEDLVYAVSKIGGRIADLEFFTQKVKSGTSPKETVNKMISRAVMHIRGDGFGFSLGKHSKNTASEAASRKWTQVQLWKIIKRLAEQDSVYYDDIVVNIFGGNVEALTSLLSLNLLRVENSHVCAYSPLIKSAFQFMVHDKTISVPMDTLAIKEALGDCSVQMTRVLDELIKLKSVEPFLGNMWKWTGLFLPPSLLRQVTLEQQMKSITTKITTLNTQLRNLY